MKYFKQLFCFLLLFLSLFQNSSILFSTSVYSLKSIRQTTHFKMNKFKKLFAKRIKKAPIEEIKIEHVKSFFPMINIDWFGFKIDKKQNIYYSSMEPWQKEFGYDKLYDKAAPFLDKTKIKFWYDNKKWVVWLWKGYYGPVLGMGSELGTYIKEPFVKLPIPKKIGYRGANKDEMLTVSYKIIQNGNEIFKFEPQKHWWLAGMNPSAPLFSNLKMEAIITFPSEEMAKIFEEALIKKDSKRGISSIKKDKNTVIFDWE